MKISVGKKVKDLAVISSDNKKMLSDYLNKNLILYFYPRDLTPGCTTESNEFNDSLNKIKKLGWNVVGVSRDTIKSHEKFITNTHLSFL
jgi:peroxiredoxin Q/BCP